ncbi:hypothetical protein N7931_08620 [Catenovulum sp. 2E275]|uniref:hypothetical protein n=1 Tax=Catenovulum sp. 2E275 TaxID=2980497 RepID=UPI0021CF2C18|nr:hypothetical protein [Catenovulum sp. 2E275]MCU4675693.1 hypothetical protein [Catenovulum sp. 2E275]
MFQADTFIFKNTDFDYAHNQLNLNYQFGDYHFCETLSFDSTQIQLDLTQTSIAKAINYLHLVAGVSYFKLQPFASIELETTQLNQLEADFFKKLYINGLAEFAYRNNLDITQGCHFPIAAQASLSEPQSQTITDLSQKKSQHALVLIGGGKDSLVSIEALKQAGKKVTLFAVNPVQPILNCVKQSGLPFVAVKRVLDPQLFKLNEQGALNGHVPITAIISFTAFIVAQALGCDAIITSNEASANEATLVKNGVAINHQYSKSYEFEQDFTGFVQHFVNPNLAYFSLLRPFTEMRIVKEFARFEQYDDVFTSCNKAFKIYHQKSDTRWCLACPKCHFVYLMFAVSGMNEARLNRIFNGNPLTNIDFLQDYKELSGLTESKPWECVGEKLESAAAIYYLSQQAESTDYPVIKALANQLVQAYGEEKLQAALISLLKVRTPHAIPTDYQGCFSDV